MASFPSSAICAREPAPVTKSRYASEKVWPAIVGALPSSISLRIFLLLPRPSVLLSMEKLSPDLGMLSNAL